LARLARSAISRLLSAAIRRRRKITSAASSPSGNAARASQYGAKNRSCPVIT
jgi:hypothetical protein